jgi:hypothetical protein
MPYTDKSLQSAAAKRHYKRNSDAMKKRAVAHTLRARERNRKFIENLKSTTPCKDCSISYPSFVMQFDHVRGIKRGDISGMANAPASMTTLVDEISKCEVVCANCHAIRTHSSRAM